MPIIFADHNPRTIDEAIVILESRLDESEKQVVRDDDAWLHMGFGRAIRNGWGLWHDSLLAQHFKTVHGIGHADDMSGLILEGLRCRLTGQTFDLKGKVRYYRDYWLGQGVDPVTQEEIIPKRKGLISRLFNRD